MILLLSWLASEINIQLVPMMCSYLSQ
jgi:hypothetical protein